MIVYTFLRKSVSSTMLSYISLQIVFVYFAIFDMCLYVCMFVFIYILDLYVDCTRGVQYVMKTAQYIPKFYIYTLHNYFYLNVCFLAK